jgi:hypothetical protein
MLPEYLEKNGTFGGGESPAEVYFQRFEAPNFGGVTPSRIPLLAKRARRPAVSLSKGGAPSISFFFTAGRLQVAVRDQFHTFFLQDVTYRGQGQDS